MDIQKEREAFLHEFEKTEQYRQQYGFYKIPLKYDEQKETWNFYDVQAAWEMWQAATAQAVQEVITIGNELQSWVAVWSFKARHDHEDYIVVDANLLADKIEKLTGANA